MHTFSKTYPWLTSFLFVMLLLQSPYQTKAQKGLDVKDDTLTQSVLIHPVIETNGNELLFSREHTYKEHLRLGDQLARDFIVTSATEDGIIQPFKNDGKQNEDYIGWRKNVMAPISGTVDLVNHPDTTNVPGKMNRDAKPGRVYIKNDEGVTVILVHVREIEVKEGQKVQAGETVAKVGNNGNSTGPHIHVGAWKDNTPLQIQMDLYAAERQIEEKESSK